MSSKAVYSVIVPSSLILAFLSPAHALADLSLCSGVWTNRTCPEAVAKLEEAREVADARSDIKGNIYRSVLALASSSKAVPSLAKIEAEELRTYCLREDIPVAKCEARALQVRKSVGQALERERKAALDRERLRIEHKKLEQRGKALLLQEKRRKR